jgi:sulfur carrier protein
MQVIVNGERTEIVATDLNGLLGELDYEDTHVVIAVNCHVVPHARWADTELNTGDEIEIVTPRQGG